MDTSSPSLSLSWGCHGLSLCAGDDTCDEQVCRFAAYPLPHANAVFGDESRRFQGLGKNHTFRSTLYSVRKEVRAILLEVPLRISCALSTNGVFTLEVGKVSPNYIRNQSHMDASNYAVLLGRNNPRHLRVVKESDTSKSVIDGSY